MTLEGVISAMCINSESDIVAIASTTSDSTPLLRIFSRRTGELLLKSSTVFSPLHSVTHFVSDGRLLVACDSLRQVVVLEIRDEGRRVTQLINFVVRELVSPPIIMSLHLKGAELVIASNTMITVWNITPRNPSSAFYCFDVPLRNPRRCLCPVWESRRIVCSVGREILLLDMGGLTLRHIKPAQPLIHGCDVSALHADRHHIVSGDINGTIKIWNAQSGACLHVLHPHDGLVRFVSLSRGESVGWVIAGFESAVHLYYFERKSMHHVRSLSSTTHSTDEIHESEGKQFRPWHFLVSSASSRRQPCVIL